MKTVKITLSQLEQYLSKAAWILKGPVDAADFKVYIFPLLFFKRISDVYDDEYKQALDESGGCGICQPSRISPLYYSRKLSLE